MFAFHRFLRLNCYFFLAISSIMIISRRAMKLTVSFRIPFDQPSVGNLHVSHLLHRHECSSQSHVIHRAIFGIHRHPVNDEKTRTELGGDLEGGLEIEEEKPKDTV